ncbi:hypothetical protein D3C71_1376150 [compost metagenome]
MIPADPDDQNSEWMDAIECTANIYEDRVFVLGINDNQSKTREYLFEKGVKESTEEQRKKVLARMLKKYAA